MSSHIFMAQELIRDLNRKVTGGNVCFKFDIVTAYDRLERRFLLHTMSLFGFSETARDLIYRNLCNISYFFFIYGEIVGKVDLFVALDKDIPYCPCCLFLRNSFYQSIFACILLRRRFNLIMWAEVFSISHMFYADDVMLFTNGSQQSLTSLMRRLHTYEFSLGQSVNRKKFFLCCE